jgi:DNA polymerase-3 subunit delta'
VSGARPPILGQGRALEALKAALAGGHVHHAWIFHGPAGVGKFTTAIEFARILLDPAVDPRGLAEFRAPSAGKVASLVDSGTHPDLVVIRKERTEDSSIASLRDRKQTNIPVDLLRELMLGGEVDGRMLDAPVARTAYLGHGKVFVIDEAELLDSVGQNALLKTLEEPPPGTYIILVTTREDRLLPTIRSRCQRVAFAPLDAEAMKAWLARDGAATSLAGDRESLEWLLRFADGSPGEFSTAFRRGAHEWAKEILPAFRDLERGTFDPRLSERLAELIASCAEAIVKENPKASKDAANRLGSRLLLATLALHVRDELRTAAAAGDESAAAWRAGFTGVLDVADEAIRRHLNLKHVLANLVAQWMARGGRANLAGAR